MSEPRRELVTDFASLRTGMLIVIVGCQRCSSEHTTMLIRLVHDQPAQFASGVRRVVKSAWTVCPVSHCNSDSITPRAVELRMIYRLLDGLEPPAEYAATVRSLETMKPKVRAR